MKLKCSSSSGLRCRCQTMSILQHFIHIIFTFIFIDHIHCLPIRVYKCVYFGIYTCIKWNIQHMNMGGGKEYIRYIEEQKTSTHFNWYSISRNAFVFLQLMRVQCSISMMMITVKSTNCKCYNTRTNAACIILISNYINCLY